MVEVAELVVLVVLGLGDGLAGLVCFEELGGVEGALIADIELEGVNDVFDHFGDALKGRVLFMGGGGSRSRFSLRLQEFAKEFEAEEKEVLELLGIEEFEEVGFGDEVFVKVLALK